MMVCVFVVSVCVSVCVGQKPLLSDSIFITNPTEGRQDKTRLGAKTIWSVFL